MSLSSFSISLKAFFKNEKQKFKPSLCMPFVSLTPHASFVVAPTPVQRAPRMDDISVLSSILDGYLEPDVPVAWRSVRYSLHDQTKESAALRTLVGSTFGRTDITFNRPAPEPDQQGNEFANSSTLTLVTPSRVVQFFDLHILHTLGQGTFGCVYSVRDKVSNATLALKVMKKTRLSKAGFELIVSEQRILRKTQGSPWFLSLEASFHDTENFYLLMLDKEIMRCGRLSPDRARFYMCELLVAVTALHELGIVHRDIKPANLLIDREGHIVIADFGVAKDFELAPMPPERLAQPYWPCLPDEVYSEDLHPRDPTLLHFISRTRCGSLQEMAPEVHRGEWYSFGVDLWSAAVTLYWMLTGQSPWYSEQDEELTRMVCEDPLVFDPFDNVEEVAQDYLRWMLEKSPKDRLSVHPMMFYHKYFDGVNWDHVKNRDYDPPWVPDKLFQNYTLGPADHIVPGIPYASSTDPDPGFLYTSEKLVAATKVDDTPIFTIAMENMEASSLSQPAPTLLMVQDMFNQPQQFGSLVTSNCDLSTSSIVRPPNPSPPPTPVARTAVGLGISVEFAKSSVQHVFSGFQNRKSATFSSNSSPSQSPSASSITLARLPNISFSAAKLSVIENDSNELASFQTNSLLRSFSESGNTRLAISPNSSSSFRQPSVASITSIPVSSTLSSPKEQSKVLSTPACKPQPRMGVLRRVKRWFLQIRYLPSYLPESQQQASFQENER
ncbi:kinase-like protein [Tricholoma matsutake]|nr:kinase-like protein [Tricholoma matsutake 945]